MPTLNVNGIRCDPFPLKILQDQLARPIISNAIDHGSSASQPGCRNDGCRDRAAALDRHGCGLLRFPPGREMLHDGQQVDRGGSQSNDINTLFTHDRISFAYVILSAPGNGEKRFSECVI
jgi:hypothetical protein